VGICWEVGINCGSGSWVNAFPHNSNAVIKNAMKLASRAFMGIPIIDKPESELNQRILCRKKP
jgi:hypothetical protein